MRRTENFMEDGQAIQRLKQGDLSGLQPLIARYQVQAARAAFLITQDERLAEDCVQDVFARIFEHIQRFDDSQPFQPYLMRSVIHAALNAVRGRSRIVSLDDEQNALEGLLDQAASVESQIESGQLQEEILTALSKLSPRQRAAIVQRYYLEMNEKEMVQTLSAAPGTIKWTLNVARERLRHLLGQKGASHD
jgi:RNA polymerase sigma-70 factor (ECF subfamily)